MERVEDEDEERARVRAGVAGVSVPPIDLFLERFARASTFSLRSVFALVFAFADELGLAAAAAAARAAPRNA